MEKVYDTKGFRASENINFEDYFKNFREICPPVGNSVVETFLNLVDLNLGEFGEDFGEYFDQIEATCNHENLRCVDEPPSLPMEIPEKLTTKTKFEDYYPITVESRKLNVIRAKEALENRWLTPEYKFTGKRFIKTSFGKTLEPELSDNIEAGAQYIFSIIIYKPTSIYIGQRNSAEKLRFAYEIEALGTNLLSQIVDIIECMSNSAIIKEVENTKVDLSEFIDAKKWYPSQTVFIDGVFYNDTRPENAIDLSEEVIKWAKEKNIGKFTTAEMHKTLLSSLSPRLGYPYVYIHQGDCEHIFVFSDARLAQNGDCLKIEEYPKIVTFNRSSNILCFICATRVGQWMVLRCNKFPQERVFLCTECCNSYLYIDGEKKVTDFELYPYFDHKKLRL